MSDLKPKGRTKSVSKETVKSFERKLEKATKVHHDLFRLDIANTKKNVSYNEDLPNMVDVPHAHFYHTVTSDGKALENSAPTAGHFHPIEIEYDDDGKIISAKCGRAMVMHKGKPAPYKYDEHTHEMSYIVSEVVERRMTNSDAVKVMSASKADENKAAQGVRGIIA